MKFYFDQIPFFAISKMAKNQFVNLEMFKTAKNAISRQKMDLFDFTSFFAGTFLIFLALCDLMR